MIEIKNICISYDKILIEQGQLIIPDGKITIIRGPSGSGKTSLLYLAGLLKRDKSMTYLFDGKRIAYRESECALFRKQKIGYVFQENSLITHLSILENIRFYANMANQTISEDEAQVLLKRVCLDKEIHQSITHLSGGERQRLAIACALVKEPRLLILDEPTSALDEENMCIVMNVLKQLAKDGFMILLASHHPAVMAMGDIIYEIKDRKLICDQVPQLLGQEVQIPQKNRLGLKFYLRYYALYLKEQLHLQLAMIVLCALAIALQISYQSVYEGYETAMKINEKMTGNTELCISCLDEKGSLQPLDKKMSERIRSIAYCSSLHPYYEMTVEKISGLTDLADIKLTAVPYVSERNLQASCQNAKTTRNGIYLSDKAAKVLGLEETDGQKIDISGMMPDSQPFYLEGMDINGVLKKSFDDPYTKQELVIYVPYENLPKTDEKSVIYWLAYAVHHDTAVALEEKITEMDENLHVSVYSPYARSVYLVRSLRSMDTYCPFMVHTSFLISFVMIFLVYTRYLKHRKMEICLLKANGMNRWEIFKLILCELFVQSLLTGLLAGLFVWLLCHGTAYLLYTVIPVNYLKASLQSFGLSIMMMLVPASVTLLVYQLYDPAVVLRNDL